MSYVIAVAVSVAFAIAVLLASPDKFADSLKSKPFIVAVLCVDIVYMTVNLILTVLLFQLVPSVNCFASMVLTVVTVFTVLFSTTTRIGAYALAVALSMIFVTLSVLHLPAERGIKEFDGVEYIGITEPWLTAVGTLEGMYEADKSVYYYEKVFPFVMSKNYAIVEKNGSFTYYTD